MICEGAALPCAKRRDAHCFVLFVGTDIGTSAEHLHEHVERRQLSRQDLALTSAIGYSSKKATENEHE